MYMFDLPDDVLRKIYEYDSLKNDHQKKIISELESYLDDYDRKFWNYHMMKSNVYSNTNGVGKWINKYGINYNPTKFILKKGK